MSSLGRDADVIVIGAGIAGLAAGVRASEQGQRVIVLEQGEGERYPCNSRYALGWLHLNYHDVGLPPEELAESLLRTAPADVDRELVRLIALNTGRAVRWLRGAADARFIRIGPAPYEKWVMAPPRRPQPGLVWPGSGPDRVLRNLANRMEAHGSPVRTGHRVIDIRRDGARMAVVAVTDGGEATFSARAVVIADGGFQADETALAHITPAPARVLQRNAGTGKGFSLRWGQRAGASISELKNFYGHVISRDALQRPDLWPYPMIDGLANAGIVVAPDGERFVDEGQTGVFIANRIARRADPLDSFVVFDGRTWDTVGRAHKIPANPLLRTHGGTIHEAGTIADLARAAGIAGDALQRTVHQFNAAADTGALAALSPPRATARMKPRALTEAPFLAVPVCAGVTYTMGGVRINRESQVLAKDGDPIAGVYAAGTAVGGIEGGDTSFYMGGLCRALVLGFLAGERVASARSPPQAVPEAATR